MTTDHRVRTILARQFGIRGDELQATTTIQSLGADSYDLVELQTSILEEFDLELPEEMAPDAITVGDIVRIIDAAQEAYACAPSMR